MKSDRSKPVTLTVKHERSLPNKIENFVYISSDYIIDANQHIIKFRTGKSSAVNYPVMFDKNVKKGEIVLPNELRKDLGFDLGAKIECGLDVARDDEWLAVESITFAIEKTLDSVIKTREVDPDEIKQTIRGALMFFGLDYPLQVGQKFVIPFKNVRLKLRIDQVSDKARGADNHVNKYFRFSDNSKIKLLNEQSHYFKLVSKADPVLYEVEDDADTPDHLSEIPLDFTSRGIGGHKKEIAYIVRNLFYTRTTDKEYLAGYGVTKHAKGMLLYGPPGTGKTLIAKSISELFTKEQVVIIEGPQLKNMYYGATQQNLRDLFVKARKKPNKLFVFIFDEIDALFSTRGSDPGTTTQTNNDLISGILTILDGPDSPKNIVVIGTTNRKEVIDPALLRAGRLDIHVYIGLPDEMGRLEILQVHTKDMVKTLHKNVDLNEIARLSKNFSGAELARLVSLAQIMAIGENYVAKDNKLVFREDIKGIEQAQKVTQQHFLRALRDVKPAFGVDEDFSNANLRIAIYDEKLKSLIARYQKSIAALQNSKGMRQLNLLICGEPGTGKTSLAIHLALQSRFPYLQILTPNKLLSHPIGKQLDIIDEMFAKARQSAEPSVIILDGIESIIEATFDHVQYNNKIRLKIREMLKESRNSDNKLIVITVAESREYMRQLGIEANISEAAVLDKIYLDASNPILCSAVMASIAATLDVKIVNDLSPRDVGLMAELPVNDLLYEIRKYCSETGGAILKLSEFMRQLPSQWVMNEVVADAKDIAETRPVLSFFRK